MASKHFLKDITGKSVLPNLNDLLKSVGLKGLVPDSVGDYIDDVAKLEEDGVHQYLCNIDKAPKGENCEVNKAIAEREKDREIGWVQWDTSKPKRLLYLVDGKIVERADIARKQRVKPINLRGGRFEKGGRNLRSNNLGGTVTGQGLSNKPNGTFLKRSVKTDRKADNNFTDAVNGKQGQSVGTRAILFNQDGSVTTGADNIRNAAVAKERSSNIPTETISNGGIPKNIKKATPYLSSKHPNKSKIAGTTDFAGGVAAIGGVAALAGTIALLMPLHFITSAITFLTSITTFFTNVNNAANTFLTVADALLGMFGIKGSGKKLKGFVTEIVDNALGKKNVQAVKDAFASGINSLAVTTKLLEKVQSMRSRSDNKVDELALALGTLNNSMGAAGLIPPELMATSKAIDELVDTRSKTDPELKDGITSLTAELKDNKEATATLKSEQEERDKVKAKTAKDVADVSKLVSVVKTDVDKIDVNKL
jgi:hypothetical protein